MNKPLNDEFSADVWAKEFMKINGDKLQTLDHDLMRAWFANAIMAGYDHTMREKPEVVPAMGREELVDILKKVEVGNHDDNCKMPIPSYFIERIADALLGKVGKVRLPPIKTGTGANGDYFSEYSFGYNQALADVEELNK